MRFPRAMIFTLAAALACLLPELAHASEASLVLPDLNSVTFLGLPGGTLLLWMGLVICSAPVSVAQRVRGLRIGADDWLTKPCHPEELIARVEAVVRRRKRAETRVDALPVLIGEVEIRPDQFQAFVGGVSVDLTRREFELIRLLAEAEGQVMQREEMYQQVWGYAMVHGDRSVDVFVRKLRQKLERASPDWRYSHAHCGIGYRFAAEAAEAAEVGAPVGLPEVSVEPAPAPAPSATLA